jgi:hypothetical protein
MKEEESLVVQVHTDSTIPLPNQQNLLAMPGGHSNFMEFDENQNELKNEDMGISGIKFSSIGSKSSRSRSRRMTKVMKKTQMIESRHVRTVYSKENEVRYTEDVNKKVKKIYTDIEDFKTSFHSSELPMEAKTGEGVLLKTPRSLKADMDCNRVLMQKSDSRVKTFYEILTKGNENSLKNYKGNFEEREKVQKRLFEDEEDDKNESIRSVKEQLKYSEKSLKDNEIKFRNSESFDFDKKFKEILNKKIDDGYYNPMKKYRKQKEKGRQMLNKTEEQKKSKKKISLMKSCLRDQNENRISKQSLQRNLNFASVLSEGEREVDEVDSNIDSQPFSSALESSKLAKNYKTQGEKNEGKISNIFKVSDPEATENIIKEMDLENNPSLKPSQYFTRAKNIFKYDSPNFEVLKFQRSPLNPKNDYYINSPTRVNKTKKSYILKQRGPLFSFNQNSTKLESSKNFDSLLKTLDKELMQLDSKIEDFQSLIERSEKSTPVKNVKNRKFESSEKKSTAVSVKKNSSFRYQTQTPKKKRKGDSMFTVNVTLEDLVNNSYSGKKRGKKEFKKIGGKKAEFGLMIGGRKSRKDVEVSDFGEKLERGEKSFGEHLKQKRRSSLGMAGMVGKRRLESEREDEYGFAVRDVYVDEPGREQPMPREFKVKPKKYDPKYIEMMYEKNLLRHNLKMEQKRKLDILREEIELKECTFRPKRTVKKLYEPKRGFLERQDEWLTEKKKNLEIKETGKLIRFYRDCTFSPKLLSSRRHSEVAFGKIYKGDQKEYVCSLIDLELVCTRDRKPGSSMSRARRKNWNKSCMDRRNRRN